MFVIGRESVPLPQFLVDIFDRADRGQAICGKALLAIMHDAAVVVWDLQAVYIAVAVLFEVVFFSCVEGDRDNGTFVRAQDEFVFHTYGLNCTCTGSEGFRKDCVL